MTNGFVVFSPRFNTTTKAAFFHQEMMDEKELSATAIKSIAEVNGGIGFQVCPGFIQVDCDTVDG